MKKLPSLILALIVFSSESFTQWQKYDFSNSTVVMSVDSYGNNAALIGGYYDSLSQSAKGWYSTDGGTSWSPSQLPDSVVFFYGLQMMNASLAYGSGTKSLSGQQSGMFLQSNNGGQLWTEKGNLPVSVTGLRNIHFLSETTGFAVAIEENSSGIIKTTDGGLTWSWSYSPISGMALKDISFCNSTIGFVSGKSGQYNCVILKTTNAGATWSSELLQNENYLSAFRCISPEKILYTTVSKIFLSSDAGNTWNMIFDLPSPSYFHGLNGLQGGLVVAYGSLYNIYEQIPFVYASFDNGLTWIQSTLDTLGISFLFTNSKIINESEWYLLGRQNIIGNQSGPGFLLKTNNSGGLPVEMVSFTARQDGETVKLEWITSSEKNNRGFEIERKSDGFVYNTIGFVKGNGTTTEKQYYSFTDNPGTYLKKLSYRLKQIDYNGTFTYTDEVTLDVVHPFEFLLFQNYPNPFNPSTTIKYSLPEAGKVTLSIYDQLGQEIEILTDEEKPSGNYDITWDASELPGGVYFCRMLTGEFSMTRKLMLMK